MTLTITDDYGDEVRVESVGQLVYLYSRDNEFAYEFSLYGVHKLIEALEKARDEVILNQVTED